MAAITFLAAVFLSSLTCQRAHGPLGRILLSEDAGFITGQTLHVDGGASIGKAGF